MVKKEDDGEVCEPCILAVSLGTTLRVCKRIGNKEQCDILYKKLINDEIPPEEVFKKVRKLAKGHKKEMEILDMVDDFRKGKESDKKKTKKKRKSKRR